MVKKHIKNIFFLGAILLFSQAKAQSVEDILGHTFVADETTNFIKKLSTATPEEEFLPYQRMYRQNYFADGISLDYNSDIAVYRVMLYDSGYTYQQYAHKMPYGLSWGMKLPEIEDITGIHDPMDKNEFATVLSQDDYTIEFYFTSFKLSHMRITASLKTLEKNKEEIAKANTLRLLPNGVVKEGDVISGNGTMIWGNGVSVYKGEWSYGLPHGRGQYVDTFGTKYEGDFKLGFFWGQGDFFSKAYGYSYSGAYAMGTKHGEGRAQYTNSAKYQGEWVRDNMHGSGVYSIGKRYVYKGEMNQNAITGEGILNTPDGSVVGSFRNGKPHGICTQTTIDNVQSVTGPFVDGKKNGKFTAYVLGEERIIYYENDIEIVKKEN